MELKWNLAGVWMTVFLLLLVRTIEGKTSTINMFDRCGTYSSNKNYIKVDDRDTVYLNIEGARWYSARKCQITFKADDGFDDLQVRYSKYEVNECDVKVEVWTSSYSSFFGSPEYSYSCSNVPLTNWKVTMNRYVKIVVTRDFSTSRDFSINLQISVQDYSSDTSDVHEVLSVSGSVTKVIVGSVIGVIVIVVSIIVLVVCCRCMKSRQGGNSGTVYRQQYHSAPTTTQTSTTQDWAPPPGHMGHPVQPTAPYPTLPTYPQQQAGYPYGYGQGQPLLEPTAPGYLSGPPAYPGHPPQGYPTGQPTNVYPTGQPAPGYPMGQQTAPGYPTAPPAYPEPSAPPGLMNQPPPPYPGLEDPPLKQ